MMPVTNKVWFELKQLRKVRYYVVYSIVELINPINYPKLNVFRKQFTELEFNHFITKVMLTPNLRQVCYVVKG